MIDMKMKQARYYSPLGSCDNALYCATKIFKQGYTPSRGCSDPPLRIEGKSVLKRLPHIHTVYYPNSIYPVLASFLSSSNILSLSSHRRLRNGSAVGTYVENTSGYRDAHFLRSLYLGRAVQLEAVLFDTIDIDD